MTLSEETKILLSQLVDGELPVDQANEILAEIFDELSHVLGSAEAGMELNTMLQLRRTLRPWRQQAPPKMPGMLLGTAEGLIASVEKGTGDEGCRRVGEDGILPNSRAVPLTLALSHAAAHDGREKRRSVRHVLSLASAAVLGGILASGGFLLGSRHAGERVVDPAVRPPVVIVTPERQREIAQAFDLHESVAGPLNWYAADESTILVSPAAKTEAARQPIAVVLHLAPDASCPCTEAIPEKTYVIVCRNSNPAAIELPPSAMAAGLRLRLHSTEAGGQVKLQYVLVATGPDRGLEDAALVGHREVGLGQTSLGQLTLKDCLVNVDASAWVMRDQRKL